MGPCRYTVQCPAGGPAGCARLPVSVREGKNQGGVGGAPRARPFVRGRLSGTGVMGAGLGVTGLSTRA